MNTISVALCTYDGRLYLSEQLDSILSQTRLPDEIVVFDDGSSDGTADILEEYRNKFPELFEVHYNDNTLGVVKNFERCIRACNGDLIVLCDQDDVWREDKLERQSLAFRRYNPVLTFHNSTVTDEHLNPISDLWTEIGYTPNRVCEPKTALVELLQRNMVQGATICFHARLVPKVTPIPPNWSHDYYIALIAALLGELYDIDSELLSYRQHEDQVMGARTHIWKKLVSGSQTGASEYIAESKKWKTVNDVLNSFDDRELTVDRNEARRLFQRRIDFEQSRATIRNSGITIRERLDVIKKNIQSGRYSVYANGYQSVFKDLMALSRRAN